VIINLEEIKERIKEELVFYGNVLGQANYKLAKVIYEKTKDLSYTDTHRIYGFISDYLGISVRTIINLVKIYRKLEKYQLWHNETGLFKFRLFQLAYYIDKNTSEPSILTEKVYYDIINNPNLRIWFESASWKDILSWFKEVYKTYLRVFRPKQTINYTCDICGIELKLEDYKKTWDNLPICFNCYDRLKEENKEKIAILKNKIAKLWKESKIRSLQTELEKTKLELLKTIEEFDKLRLSKSRKYKKILAKIEG
jgi:hypothetical protein